MISTDDFMLLCLNLFHFFEWPANCSLESVKLHSSCKIHCLGLPDVTSFLPALTSCTHKDNQFDYLCCLFNQQVSESGGKGGGKSPISRSVQFTVVQMSNVLIQVPRFTSQLNGEVCEKRNWFYIFFYCRKWSFDSQRLTCFKPLKGAFCKNSPLCEDDLQVQRRACWVTVSVNCCISDQKNDFKGISSNEKRSFLLWISGISIRERAISSG